jgi:hypothetical protein
MMNKDMFQRGFFVTMFVVLFYSLAQGALPPRQELVGRGKVVGGEAGKGFSLLKVSKAKTQKGERWVLNIGNEKGQAKKGRPGYYHVELNSQKKKLSVDLSQLHLSKVTEAQLRKVIATSQFITSPKLKSDPMDQTLNMEFELKKNPKVKVYQVSGVKGTSRIVIDLSE